MQQAATTFTEKQGTQAVIKLQSMVNNKESEESARRRWNSFTDNEKLQTERVYNQFFGAGRN